IQPILPELKKRSEARIASSKDFGYLRQDIARLKKLLAEKSVSLNEQQRLKEKQEAEDRTKKRKEELKARPEPKMKVYPVTLNDVDKPGLPPATSLKELNKAESKPSAADADGTSADTTPDETATPALDIDLEETERILMDMISLHPITKASR